MYWIWIWIPSTLKLCSFTNLGSIVKSLLLKVENKSLLLGVKTKFSFQFYISILLTLFSVFLSRLDCSECWHLSEIFLVCVHSYLILIKLWNTINRYNMVKYLLFRERDEIELSVVQGESTNSYSFLVGVV